MNKTTNMYEGKIVIYEWKKAKVIWKNTYFLSLVLQNEGKFSCSKEDIIHTTRSKITILDHKKHPDKYSQVQHTHFIGKPTILEINNKEAMQGIFNAFSKTIPTESDKDLYIDSSTKEAFNETNQGDYISQKELAALWQISRSSEWCDIFEEITGRQIGLKSDMIALFQSAKKSEINLSKILLSPRLEKYVKRTSPFAFD